MIRRKTTIEETPLIIKYESAETLNRAELDEEEAQVAKHGGISMTWKNLRVRAIIKKKHILRSTRTSKEIIHNVNGYVEPSSLIAILGASGSGKSTLMSALASRLQGDLKIDGDIRVNGKNVGLEEMKTISGFVYQDDMFIPTLTVLEHLHFVSKLKLSKHLTTKHREKLVKEVITDVGLASCANRFIGSSNYGSEKTNLSGGELKRLSVATELLTNPPLLFCDEPTTGLDSFTAFNLMKVMSDLTRQKAKTIICSIHQPSAKIFDLFDQIILLQNGRIAFNGTVADAMIFFQSMGYPYNESQNPADYLVKSLAVVPEREFQSADEESGGICTRFQRSKYAQIVERRIDQENRENPFILPKNTESISWFYMLCLLTYRDVLTIVRDPRIQLLKFIDKVLLGVIIGIIMMGTLTRTQAGIVAVKGVLFSMVTQNSLTASMRVLNHFPSKMHGFLREYSNNTNTPLIFYLSNVVSLIPGFLLETTLFVTLAYMLAGLRSTWFAFSSTLFIIIASMNVGSAFGIFVSLATNNILISGTIVEGVAATFNPMAGVLMSVKSIPWTLVWIRYISWMTYTMEALLILQLEGVNHIQCPDSPELPCLKNGQQVLEAMGFDAANFRIDVIMICCIYFVLQVLGFITLRIRIHFMTNP